MIYRIFKSVAVLLVTTFAFAAGNSRVKVSVQGNVSESTIADWIAGTMITDTSVITRSVLDTLVTRGYFEAEVRLSDDTLIVRSGPQFELSKVHVIGDTSVVSRSVLIEMEMQHDVPFASWRIEQSIDVLLSWCESNGYPFAQVSLDSLGIDTARKSVTPHLMLLVGPRIVINFIEFQGNEISKNKLLERESRLKLGSRYDISKAKLARRRLLQLEYIRSVSGPTIVLDDAGKSGLLFDVTENKLSRIDVVAGLSPNAEGEKQIVTGLIDLQFLNLFGTGRRGKVFWQRPANGVQALALGWREPWIAGSPLFADGSFEQRVEDTLYVTRRYGVRAGVPVSAAAEIFAGVAREEVLVDSTVALSLGIVANQTVLFELGLVFDTRDHSTNPRGGIRFETIAARGVRTTEEPPSGSNAKEFQQRRATVDIEVNREVLPYWIAHASGHARVLSTDEPRIQASDLFKLGGARTMRGYKEEQFVGEQAAWTTLEVRYLLGTSSRFAVFTDWGAVANQKIASTSSASDQIVKGSYGVGMRLETAIGVWGVDYGIATGASPLNGQLHVSLLSLF